MKILCFKVATQKCLCEVSKRPYKKGGGVFCFYLCLFFVCLSVYLPNVYGYFACMYILIMGISLLGLVLEMVVSCHGPDRHQTHVFWKNSQCSNLRTTFPTFCMFFTSVAEIKVKGTGYSNTWLWVWLLLLNFSSHKWSLYRCMF